MSCTPLQERDRRKAVRPCIPWLHRFASPVAHATHLLSCVPRHAIQLWRSRDARRGSCPPARWCWPVAAGRSRRSTRRGATPSASPTSSGGWPRGPSSSGSPSSASRVYAMRVQPAVAQPARGAAPDHRWRRRPADRGAGRAPGLWAGPAAGSPGAGAGGQPEDRRLRRAVVVAGPLPHARRRRRGVELANEIRLPVGERVEFQLESPDVIHSFWIPALGGKVDMIPGRRNRLDARADADRRLPRRLRRVLRRPRTRS